MTSNPIATVFGGTGFLGRKIVGELLDCGYRVRVAARNPARSRPLVDDLQRTELVQADVCDPASIIAAIDGADAVANAVSLYAETGELTFRAVHVEGAAHLAEAARQRGVRRLVQLSGIGATPDSRSRYIRCRAEGEIAVQHAFGDAVIVRPSVMFGPEDSFLNALIPMVRRLPILPLFGFGRTRLQPVFVDDVAKAVARLLTDTNIKTDVCELGGPEIYTYRQLLQLVGRVTGHRRLFAPVPFPAWYAIAAVASLLPNPPITSTQIDLMRSDNVASPTQASLAYLELSPMAIKTVLSEMIEGANKGAEESWNK